MRGESPREKKFTVPKYRSGVGRLYETGDAGNAGSATAATQASKQQPAG
jgi:hypothetical protein